MQAATDPLVLTVYAHRKYPPPASLCRYVINNRATPCLVSSGPEPLHSSAAWRRPVGLSRVSAASNDTPGNESTLGSWDVERVDSVGTER
ncbi:hypothetical protein C0Q70_02616 [Pomacea canaliculata]|uniref:Uncharacterized protein n=1 Tax=Pomacea canaliculata TaxID=400727 RepID=A0A2T7PQF1_POMCA|nr:hypothetical protein C0Q70_02616 [Pomacea canaliculata]